MKGLILAAGYGTRLIETARGTEYEDYVSKTPKPLLDIGGKPLISTLVERLREINVSEIIVVCNDKYFKQFESWRGDDESIKLINDGSINNESRLGAIKDMAIGMGLLSNPIEDDFVVLVGDRWIDFSLRGLNQCFREKGSSVVPALKVASIEEAEGKSQMKHDESGRITFFDEKMKVPITTTICLPLYFLKWEDCLLLKDFLSEQNLDAPGYFIKYLVNKKPIHAMEVLGKSYDLGTLNKYLDAKAKVEA
tara:strand:+ start:7741 stop:8493 length:753 start_codon:yes stop_codon:yes gene_type:complete